MSHFPSPTALTNEELVRYAATALIKDELPKDWQTELVKRLDHLVELTHTQQSRKPSHY